MLTVNGLLFLHEQPGGVAFCVSEGQAMLPQVKVICVSVRGS